eukprot:7052778-Karenia_brevis.AAC.1
MVSVLAGQAIIVPSGFLLYEVSGKPAHILHWPFATKASLEPLLPSDFEDVQLLFSNTQGVDEIHEAVTVGYD